MKTMLFSILAVLLASLAVAVPPAASPEAAATASAEEAAKRATVPAGMTVSLWAAEPLLANPVSFCFDEQGRAFVAETTRFDHGVPDTRGHMHWLDDDIGSRSVQDRLDMYIRHKYGDFTKYDDQVRRVWDSTGKGIADKSTVFAKGFNKPEDGVMAGVLARKGDVYVANIPSLYKLRDSKNEGVADSREVMSTGYGVRVQFLGHDLHGLRMGPDGRLYFSIGDRGFNIINKEGKYLNNPESGAVLRCEPDGSFLEIVHVGLRNPQKLAFDDYGNLFTYDNNCDSGDKARWVYIVPGGDSGWRCGYQYGTYYHTPSVKQGNRGPWNTDNIWALEGGPAYVTPPLAHFGNGPAGITHYPGIGLNDKYKDHFFACDFTSNPQSSVIWSLAVKPKGASFEVVDLQPFVKNMVPTDCEFGPDSNFYWSDWIGGWNPQDKGRLFKVTDAEAQKNPAVKEAKELLAAGMSKKTVPELIKLLEHPHQQVRQEAQFELASGERKLPDSVPALATHLKDSKHQLSRLHAIWALGQFSRKDLRAVAKVAEYCNDADPIIRSHVLKALADVPWKSFGNAADIFSYQLLLKALADSDARVQFHAALALANLFKVRGIPDDAKVSVFDFCKTATNDLNVRHATVMLLSSFKPETLRTLLTPQSTAAVKTALILALRRIGGADADMVLRTFLFEEDAHVLTETARAVYDDRQLMGMPVLARLASKPKLPDAVIFRALAANFLMGGPSDAQRLAEFAARKSEPDYLRAVALKLLADWPKPPRRDPITGLRLDLPARDPSVVKSALNPVLDDIFLGSDALRKEAVACVKKLGLQEVGGILAGLVGDAKLPADTRVDALLALQELKAKELGDVLKLAAESPEPKLKAAVRIVRVKADPKVAEEFPAILADTTTSLVEKQMILATLGTLPESAAVDALLGEWLEKLIQGDVPAEIRLEIFEAAEARSTTHKLKTHYDFKAKLAEYDKAVRKVAGSKTDKRFPEALAGGDIGHGRAIFLNNAAVSCQRCHKLDGEGGDAGPVVNGIGKEKTREYLLESIVLPDAHIAEGFQSVILETSDGRKVSGVLRKKTKEKYTLLTPENKVLEILAEDVERERPDKSAMPEDVYKHLSRREMRDLVEFLASLKEKK